MKKKIYIIIVSVLVIAGTLLGSLYYRNSMYGKISNPTSKPILPMTGNSAHKVKLEPKEIAKQMLNDMYPGEEVKYIVLSNEGNLYDQCVNVWCIEENKVNNDVSIKRFRNKKIENYYYKFNDDIKYHIENSVQLDIRKIDSITSVEKEEKYRENYIEKNKDNVQNLGLEYYFYTHNNSILLEVHSVVFNKEGINLLEPIGYKHNVPFKEYFEKIEFEN